MHLRLGLSLALCALGLGACFNPDSAEEDGSTGSSGQADGSGTVGGATDGNGDSTEGPNTGGGADCGNGVVDDGEVCDDGVNDGAYGGCSPDCQSMAGFCGDGDITPEFEDCDDGQNTGEYGACLPGCSGIGGECGDGRVQGPETCDDLDPTPEDGCNPSCNASGATKWAYEFTSGNAGTDLDVPLMGLDADGNLLVFVNESGGPGLDHWWELRFDRQTGRVVSESEVVSATDRTIAGGEFLDDGSYVVAGPDGAAPASQAQYDTVSWGSTNVAVNPPNTAASNAALSDFDGRFAVLSETSIEVFSPAGLSLASGEFTPGLVSYADVAFLGPSGEFVLGGFTPFYGYQALMYRYNADGTFAAQSAGFDLGEQSGFTDLVNNGAGELVAIGTVQWAAGGSLRPFIGFYATNLDEVWLQVTQDGEAAGQWHDVAMTDTGLIAVAGVSSEGGDHARVRKYDQTGNIVWTADDMALGQYDAVASAGDGGHLAVATEFTTPGGDSAVRIAVLHP